MASFGFLPSLAVSSLTRLKVTFTMKWSGFALIEKNAGVLLRFAITI